MKNLTLLCIIFILSTSTLSIQESLPKLSLTEKKIERLAKHIHTKYKIKYKDVKDIVIASFKHSNKDSFPTPIDTLAIIAIESSFNKNAYSTTNDNGLMQISYKKSSTDINSNIKDGVFLLRENKKFLNTDAAIQAYNLGLTGYRKGKRNLAYLHKFKLVKLELENI